MITTRPNLGWGAFIFKQDLLRLSHKMKSGKSKIISFLKNYWPLLGYILISIVFLFPILGQQGVPFKYDWNWPIFSLTEFWRGLSGPSSMGLAGSLGKYSSAILGLPGLLHIPPPIGLKLFLILIHTAAGYGFYLFVSKRIKSKFIAFISGLAYAFTPYIFIRTIVGFIFSLISYAVLPFFLSSYLAEKRKFWQYLLPGFLFLRFRKRIRVTY